MKDIKIYLRLGSAYCLLAISLLSCIYDDMEECEDETCLISFSFVYEHNKHYEDRFADEVEYVELFIYDKEDNLFTIHRTSRTDMLSTHTVRIELPEGKYTAVAWGNCNTDDFVYNSQDKLDTHLLALTCVEEGEVAKKDFGHIYHAINTFSATGVDDTIPMSMLKNTNLLRIRLMGLTEEERVKAPEAFYTRVESNNTIYKYDNTLADCDLTSYIPNYYEDEKDVIAEFHILRIFANDMETRVTVNSRDESIRILPLERAIVPELISQFGLARPLESDPLPVNISFEEYLERYDEFELIFRVRHEDDVDGNTIIIIEPWDGISQPGEL